MQYDIFISHSSHDKSTIARPLSHALKQRGLTVWLDEENLNIGDSIRRGIDQALLKSRYGVVVISPDYLLSEWTLKELDTLFSKETQYPKSILPILHDLTIDDIKQTLPLLADKAFLSTNDDIDSLADKICQSIQTPSGNLNPATNNTPKSPIRRKSVFPDTNMQWLIGIVLVIATLVITVWITLKPSPSLAPDNEPASTGVSFQGNVTIQGCANIGDDAECSASFFGQNDTPENPSAQKTEEKQ